MRSRRFNLSMTDVSREIGISADMPNFAAKVSRPGIGSDRLGRLVPGLVALRPCPPALTRTCQ